MTNTDPPKRRSSDIEGQDSVTNPAVVASLFKDGEVRMDNIEAQVKAIKSDVEEVLDILRLGKAFFRILGYVGSAVKWMAVIGAPCVAFYYSLKGGQK